MGCRLPVPGNGFGDRSTAYSHPLVAAQDGAAAPTPWVNHPMANKSNQDKETDRKGGSKTNTGNTRQSSGSSSGSTGGTSRGGSKTSR